MRRLLLALLLPALTAGCSDCVGFTPAATTPVSAAAAPHRIEWIWVKGHAGHPDNERADKLASDAAHAARAARPA